MPLPAALVWTGFVLATILVPALIPVVVAIPPRRPGVTMASHARALGGDLRLALALSALVITFLAHQAWLMGDAITRTLYRLFISRRHLLEWVTAAQAATGPRLGLTGVYRRMAGALVVCLRGPSWPSCWRGHGTWKLALPFAAALGCLATGGALGKRRAAGRESGSGLGTGCAGPAPHCAPHLAVLRELRHAGRQRPAARIISRRSHARCSRTAPRRPISGCIFSPWPARMISVGSA